MSVKTTLMMLVKLTEIDNELDNIVATQGEVPQQIADFNSTIAALKSELQNLESQKAELESNLISSQTQVREKQEWIASREEQTKDLKTNKEYHAALKEITTAKKEIADIEASLSQTTDRLAAVSTQVSEVAAVNTPKIEETQKQIEELQAQQNVLAPQLLEFRRSRERIVVEIDANTIKLYDSVRRRSTPALSKAEDFNCMQCGTRLPPQIYNLVQVGTQLHSCPRCKRILYTDALIEI